jgi:A/G-specific adenine glycosylase
MRTSLSSAHSEALLSWYKSSARKLPWRDTTDPYHIWISEIMLQQTQVKTVLPRYLAWFEQFPDIQTLAAAPLDDVLKAWEGLGYYRRARFIHQAAGLIMEKHGGIFPQAFADIVHLPGIGRSTAGAIASFSFRQSTPVLDGNVKRVLKRWHDDSEADDKQLWAWAQRAIDHSGNPADWNQSMMELGATHCSPRSPDCSDCPLPKHCLSAHNVHESVPTKKLTVKDVHWQVDLHTCVSKGIWLAQRSDQGIWAGLWTPPITELDAAPSTPPCHIHQLTHRRLHLYGKSSDTAPSGEGQWFSKLDSIALPTGIHRLLEKHGIG